ncbi:MAG TPA: Fe-S cluster assembly protein HesB [Anaeromyxobacteraceae bacterium]|nr:Fe-S cluster assembly protein HesB [Anaeromyxobacteraceae bacterium]
METPSPFDFDLTVRSHGFYALAPWSYDTSRRSLSRALALCDGRAVVAEVGPRSGTNSRLWVTVKGRLSAGQLHEVRVQLRTCLALDEDLGPFYARVRQLAAERPDLPRLTWAAERGAGRLLRSPTVFEDAVKTLCTTNCSFALTRAMVRNLVEQLGEPTPHGARAFPTPHAMAEREERFYREVIRAGYRAGSMRAMAREVSSGALDMEAWRDATLEGDALAERIRELPGFGPYATEHLLRLLGHHDRLALDSWTRAKLARLRDRRRPPSDATIARWYAPYGRFAGLALWLEVTADWYGATPTWP